VKAYPRRRLFRGVSVGRKLSGATLAVVVLVAVAVYLGLSQYERRSRMLAKEQAAVMVMQLFSANLSAPLSFADATSVAEVVGSVSNNSEIEFGAAWALDAEHPEALGDPLGVLSRGTRRPEAPRAVPSALGARFTATHVVVEAPVKDPSGKLVGAAQLGFSTAREEAAIADIERRVLWLSMGSALGLILILSLASRIVVVRPLRRLTQAAAALKRGDKPELLTATSDELGELTHAFMEMSEAIETREQRIRDRNRDMLRILDNAEDGFITVSRAGVMSDERSQILTRWFGPAEGSGFLDYFARICPDLAGTMRVSFETLLEEFLPIEVLLDQMPRAFARDGRYFELRYRAISGPNRDLDSLLVVIHDATEAMKRERAEQNQKEMLVVFQRLMTDPAGWETFFETGSEMVKALSSADPPDDVTARRLAHTLKGNCAVMGLEGMARFMHDFEGRFTAGAARLSREDAESLLQRWGELGAICAELGAGTPSGDRIAISAEEHGELLLALERSADLGTLARQVASWRDEPVADQLGRIREQIEVLSRRLGKGEADVRTEAGNLRLPKRAFANFWAVVAHMVRNSVDHGFQTVEERVAAGKGPKNQVWLRASEEEEQEGERVFVFTISDDGRGIDWEKVAQKAAVAGLPAATRADLEQALYLGAITTRDEVSDTSGRGVGLSAVRSVVMGLGGKIEVESTVGHGTTFRIALPWTAATASLSTSNLPDARGSHVGRTPVDPVGRKGTARGGLYDKARRVLSSVRDGSS
jgi:two-component system, chemotaxis family, sensor kinase CheA